MGPRKFGGLSHGDIDKAEEYYDLKVTVLSLRPDGVCMVERKSKRFHGTELYVNGYEGHFSLVTDPDAFTFSFLC